MERELAQGMTAFKSPLGEISVATADFVATALSRCVHARDHGRHKAAKRKRKSAINLDDVRSQISEMGDDMGCTIYTKEKEIEKMAVLRKRQKVAFEKAKKKEDALRRESVLDEALHKINIDRKEKGGIRKPIDVKEYVDGKKDFGWAMKVCRDQRNREDRKERRRMLVKKIREAKIVGEKVMVIAKTNERTN